MANGSVVTNAEMSCQASKQPILIIGGGLSGLALGHGFKAHNIPFHIFERDDSPLFRAQGYRIRIQDFYLKQLLPAGLWSEFENCCADFTPGGVRLDAITGQPAAAGFGRGGPPGGGSRGPPNPVMPEGNPMNVDRRVLRNLMVEPLMKEGSITFGKKFVKYETTDNGVTAHFADGSHYEGRLLIGADGSRSKVRKQLLPHFQVFDTEGRAVFGKTLIKDDIWNRIPKGVAGGMSLISDVRDSTRPVRLLCEVMHFANRDKVDTQLPQDYLYWVLALNKSQHKMDDVKFVHLSNKDSMVVLENLTEGWDELCQGIVKTQIPDQVSTLAFPIADPKMEDWEANARVTLMGDAAHPMTPVGGVGANSAFQDATLVLKAVLNGGSLDDIKGYEATMRQNARRYVAASVQGSMMMFGMQPFETLKPWSLWN